VKAEKTYDRPLSTRGRWGLFLVLAVTMVLLGAILHPMELADFNSEIDGFVLSAEMLYSGQLPPDPYRPLLYPLLVAGGLPVVSGFAAARLVTGLATALFVLVSYLLAERLHGRLVARLTVILTLLVHHVPIEGMLATSDMLYAALSLLTILLSVRVADDATPGRLVALAGAFAAAWSTRYQAVALVPTILLAIALSEGDGVQVKLRRVGIWAAAALVFSIPSMALNTMRFGSPLYNENWANLPIKLYADGDWSYFAQMPFDGWWSVLSHAPLEILERFLLDLSRLLPGDLPHLLGGGVAGMMLTALAVLGILHAMIVEDDRGATVPTLLAVALTAAGVVFTFFPLPRLLLLLVPVLVGFALGALRALLPDRPRIVVAIAASIGVLLAWGTVVRFVEFFGQHPRAEVAIARRLSGRVGTSAKIASTYYALGWRVDNPVLYLRDPFGPELGDAEAYFSAVDTILLTEHIDYLVVGEQSIRTRPTRLLAPDAVPPYLDLEDRNEGALVYRVDRSAISLELSSTCFPGVEAHSPLIDDLEDGDERILCTSDREGHWMAYDDGTMGHASLTVVDEVTGDSTRAIRLETYGFTEWGAGANVTLFQRAGDSSTPTYDASAFTGLAFRARAAEPTPIVVKLSDRWTHPDGGHCGALEGCFDAQAKTIEIGTSWMTYEISFDEIAQGGWGLQSPGPDGVEGTPDDGRLDPATLYLISFQVGVGESDVFLDDLTFLPAPAGP
jgi:hypothetical protein